MAAMVEYHNKQPLQMIENGKESRKNGANLCDSNFA